VVLGILLWVLVRSLAFATLQCGAGDDAYCCEVTGALRAAVLRFESMLDTHTAPLSLRLSCPSIKSVAEAALFRPL
jgi:hypothetical protein